MSAKEWIVIGATVTGLAAGALTYLDPVRSIEDLDRHRQQQQIEDLSDSEEQRRDRLRDGLRDAIDAENERRTGPSEVRPNEPHIRLRLRP